MADMKRRDTDHWVDVIDDWIEHLDEGMGGMAKQCADAEEAGAPPDPLPRAGAGVGDVITD